MPKPIASWKPPGIGNPLLAVDIARDPPLSAKRIR
jgi:hypothetical protein